MIADVPVHFSSDHIRPSFGRDTSVSSHPILHPILSHRSLNPSVHPTVRPVLLPIPSIHLPPHPFFRPCRHFPFHLSTYQSMRASIHVSIKRFLHASIHPAHNLSMHPTDVRPYIRPSVVHESIHPLIHLSIN